MFGLQNQWSWEHLGPMTAWLLGGPLPALHPCSSLSWPVLVRMLSVTRDFWGFLPVRADASWASVWALVSPMERGAPGEIGGDGARKFWLHAWPTQGLGYRAETMWWQET